VTERLLPIEDPVERDSRRIVREARAHEEDVADEWRRPLEIEDSDEDTEGAV
jgi:hypothetical protein